MHFQNQNPKPKNKMSNPIMAKTGFMEYVTDPNKIAGDPIITTANARIESNAVWVGLTLTDVQSIIDRRVGLRELEIFDKLEELIEDGTLSIDKEYLVTGSATLTVSMSATVTARNEEHARKLFVETAELDTEGMDDFAVEDTLDIEIEMADEC
jgi:hypothetical protein